MSVTNVMKTPVGFLYTFILVPTSTHPNKYPTYSKKYLQQVTIFGGKCAATSIADPDLIGSTNVSKYYNVN
jgi:hypothetical protein